MHTTAIAKPLNANRSHAPRRRGRRFSLRQLLYAMTACAAACGATFGWLAWHDAQRRREVATESLLRTAGATAQRSYCGPPWLTPWLGRDPRLQRITTVWIDGPEFDLQAASPLLANLPELGTLLVFSRHVFRSGEVLPMSAADSSGDRFLDPNALALLGSCRRLRKLLVDASPRSQLDDEVRIVDPQRRAALRRALPELDVEFLSVH